MFDWANAPIYYHDSVSYMTFAESLTHFQFPDFSLRTPVYPIYLLMFGTVYRFASFGQIILGAVTSVYLFNICLLILKKTNVSIFISLIASLNYQVISFQSTILSESLTTLLLAGLIYFSLLLINSVKPQIILAWTASASLLIFTKPTFLILPFLLSLLCSPRKLLVSNLVIVILVLSYSFLNLRQNNFFGLSYVTQINVFGKAFKYGYLERTFPDMPIELKYISKLYSVHKDNGWYNLTLIAREDLGNYRSFVSTLDKTNKFLIARNIPDFLIRSFRLSLELFSEEYWYPTKIHPWIMYFNPLFQIVNKTSLVMSIILLFSVIFLVLLKLKLGRHLLILLLVIIYTHFTIGFLSPTDYIRLKTPILPYTDLMFLLIIYFFFQILRVFINRPGIKDIFPGKKVSGR